MVSRVGGGGSSCGLMGITDDTELSSVDFELAFSGVLRLGSIRSAEINELRIMFNKK